MTEKEILSLKKKINKARIEVNGILENLQGYIDRVQPEGREELTRPTDEPPF